MHIPSFVTHWWNWNRQQPTTWPEKK